MAAQLARNAMPALLLGVLVPLVLTFHRDIPTRFGIVPRYGDGGNVRCSTPAQLTRMSLSYPMIL